MALLCGAAQAGRDHLHGHAQPRLRAQGDAHRPPVRRPGGRGPPRRRRLAVSRRAAAPRRRRPARRARGASACSRARTGSRCAPRPRRRPCSRCRGRDFDVCADRSQLRARHHLGHARAWTSSRGCARSTPTLPVVVMTAWGSDRGRGRGDAARRARLRAEAVGQRAAGRDAAHAARARAARCARRNRLDAETARARAHELPAMIAESRAMQRGADAARARRRRRTRTC